MPHPPSLNFFVAHLTLCSHRPVSFPPFGAANLIRGQFGKGLFQERPTLYRQLFSPPRHDIGPSGMHDPPRPYVLRTRRLDGRSYQTGEALPFQVHVFDLKLLTYFAGVPCEQRSLHLEAAARNTIQRVRVRFLSPTHLKNSPLPEFGALFARLRDRVSALRGLYGDGPLEIDFRGIGERARQIRLTEHQLTQHHRQRQSRASGRSHPLDGYTGHADYEGDLSEFLPYLEAGQWTGVGKQTVWGNGEIVTELLP